MSLNIPDSSKKRVAIIGAGFAGLLLANKIAAKGYQVVLFDKNNYHQFQPLFYQVAMAGLEPSSIAFPLRKLFQNKKDIYIRISEVKEILLSHDTLITDLGEMKFDYLVLAMGADTNFFNNEMIKKESLSMKSVSEAIYLRNKILTDFENALTTDNETTKQSNLDIVIVGGGATGVEVAGAMAEMKLHILPKDYPELNVKDVDIYLIHGSDRLLNGMSENASQKAEQFLEELGVIIKKNSRVVAFDGKTVTMQNGELLKCNKVIWAAGIVANKINGIPNEVIGSGGRILVNEYNQIKGLENIYCIGDQCLIEDENFPKGHPQVAQVALQQAKNLASNLVNLSKGNTKLNPFKYKDLGSMATIGRNKAVVDLPNFKFSGIIAWFMWLFVHLFSIIGTKIKYLFLLIGFGITLLMTNLCV